MKRKHLGKMMTEFSHELGLAQPKKRTMGRKMLMAAGGVVGFSIIRGLMSRMK